MGAGQDAVASPTDLRSSGRIATAPVREVVIAEGFGSVEVTRSEHAGRVWALPLTGVAVQVTDRDGHLVRARAVREGDALVLRTERRVRLPGGPEVIVETEERHVLRADGSLQVTNTARHGDVTQTRQLIYRRVQ